MIIECTKCGTKYRFDDAMISGEGVWVRCSRCQEQFFQSNPHQETKVPTVEETAKPEAIKDDHAEKIFENVARAEQLPLMEEARPEAKHDDTVLLTRSPLLEKEQVMHEENAIPEKKIPPDEPGGAVEEEQEPEIEEDETAVVKKEGRFTWKLVVLIVVINLLLGGVVYFFLFPDVGEQALNNIRSLPVLKNIFGPGKQPGEVNLALVKIKDVSRRLVDNFSEGPLLIVEGKVVNKSQDILTRIRIQGKLYDDTERIVQMRMSYCGNSLAEAELSALPEGEIQRRLSLPQDAMVTKDRVPPNAEIPFMIVLSLDKAGIDRKAVTIRTGVIPSSAERLLN
jgi:predicted Zn finger-like uncharacterized protein